MLVQFLILSGILSFSFTFIPALAENKGRRRKND